MSLTTAPVRPHGGPAASAARDDRLARLRHAVDHAGHLLPAQGPITVFVHHNTLHAFEDLPFDEAVRQGGKIFGCQPHLSEDRYRDALRTGRINQADLEAELREDLGGRADEPVLSFGTRFGLRLAMLRHPLRTGPATELRWFVAETDALRRVRAEAPPAVREQLIAETRRWVMRDLRAGAGQGGVDRRGRATLADLLGRFGESRIESWSPAAWEAFTLQALWRVCRDGVEGVRACAPPEPLVRHRDLLLEATGEDVDPLVNALLIRFTAAFLDQGFAHWGLPERNAGFFAAFVDVYGRSGGPPDAWLRGLPRELARLRDRGFGPLESLAESLDLLGVDEPEWDAILSGTLLALRGWAGMIRQIEGRGDRVPHPVPDGSLVEFTAVRLILERLALSHVAREAVGFDGPLAELRPEAGKRIGRHPARGPEQRAFDVFQLAQLLGWSPHDLHRLDARDWAELVGEIEEFPEVERRRVFHHAYERRYVTQALDALTVRAARGPVRVSAPRFQAVFCIDDREESFRRHVEELVPDAETFAAAGFFNVPIYFKGAADAHYTALCPIVMKPQHWVEEDVVEGLAAEHRRRATTRRALGKASHRVHVGSRTFAGGTVLSAGLGVLASVPLVGRILFPRHVAHVRKTIGRLVQPPPLTQLALERTEPTPGPEPGHLGFGVDEMAASAERLLRDLGLTANFARLVLIVGHGSTSLNNPHMSAYGCGACSGAAGGPNARAVSQMLNDPRVRATLARRGLAVPDATVFVGGFHNTCKDDVTFFDLDRLPESHRAEFEEVRRVIEEACDRNAHERCRRFMSAPLTLSPAAARRHVEERSEDLAQVRPELGHVTNAMTIVGRRDRTRGLFMDRRAFLTSYDPTRDDADRTILTRLLQAAIPVCSGIGLEYYFSHVDPAGYGSSTKLPHNVASLLGVMDGAASDLRTGLPWQMVEIHEPVRQLFVIETTPEAMLRIMDRNEAIGRLCRNGWILLAVLDPDSPEIRVFRDGGFHPYRPESRELPRAASSADWYRGWRDHLDFAEMGG